MSLLAADRFACVSIDCRLRTLRVRAGPQVWRERPVAVVSCGMRTDGGELFLA